VTADTPLACELSPTNALLRISGDDAAEFLHNQFTNDVKALAVGSAQWNGWCTPKGRFLFTFVLARDAAGYVVVLPALRQAMAKRLHVHPLRSRRRSRMSPALACHGVGRAAARRESPRAARW
jgi:hypothetical protein